MIAAPTFGITMARIWEPQTSQTLNNWLEAILNEAHRLDEWERNFIANVAVRIKNGASLTRAQEEKLEHIYATKTS